MERDAAIATLKAVEDEQRPDIDIDIVVEIDPAAGLGVYEFVGVVNFIGDLFPAKVDVSDRKAMRDYVRPNAERDTLYAF